VEELNMDETFLFEEYGSMSGQEFRKKYLNTKISKDCLDSFVELVGGTKHDKQDSKRVFSSIFLLE
jgi:hypothetical protein